MISVYVLNRYDIHKHDTQTCTLHTHIHTNYYRGMDKLTVTCKWSLVA